MFRVEVNAGFGWFLSVSEFFEDAIFANMASAMAYRDARKAETDLRYRVRESATGRTWEA